MALLDDILARLDAESVTGGATGWETSISFLPDAPNKVIAVFETGGDVPEMAMGGVNYPKPTFQIRIRGDVFEYQDARTKAQEALVALQRHQVNDQIFMAVQSAPLSLGNDKNDRPNMTINFRVTDVGGF